MDRRTARPSDGDQTYITQGGGGRGRLIRVTGAADPRLADYRDLRDVSLRKSLE